DYLNLVARVYLSSFPKPRRSGATEGTDRAQWLYSVLQLNAGRGRGAAARRQGGRLLPDFAAMRQTFRLPSAARTAWGDLRSFWVGRQQGAGELSRRSPCRPLCESTRAEASSPLRLALPRPARRLRLEYAMKSPAAVTFWRTARTELAALAAVTFALPLRFLHQAESFDPSAPHPTPVVFVHG